MGHPTGWQTGARPASVDRAAPGPRPVVEDERGVKWVEDDGLGVWAQTGPPDLTSEKTDWWGINPEGRAEAAARLDTAQTMVEETFGPVKVQP